MILLLAKIAVAVVVLGLGICAIAACMLSSQNSQLRAVREIAEQEIAELNRKLALCGDSSNQIAQDEPNPHPETERAFLGLSDPIAAMCVVSGPADLADNCGQSCPEADEAFETPEEE